MKTKIIAHYILAGLDQRHDWTVGFPLAFQDGLCPGLLPGHLGDGLQFLLLSGGLHPV